MLDSFGCSSDVQSQVEAVAADYARNAAGDSDAPVWDLKTCWYEENRYAGIVSGLINGNGLEYQLFIVDFDGENKPNGEVLLEPLYSSEENPVFYQALKSIRVNPPNCSIGDWLFKASAIVEVYEKEIEQGSSPPRTYLKAQEWSRAVAQ